MTTQILFVQGGGGENAHDDWDSKLVDSLRRELGDGYDIRYPRMPEEDEPNYARWSGALRKELDDLENGAILVAHSVGATILIYTLAEHPPRLTLGGIFLIAMPFIGKGGWPSDEVAPKPDLGSELPNAPVHLYHGDADDTAPVTHLALNAKAIPQAKAHRLKGRDHQLNNDMGEVAAEIGKL